MTTDNEWVKRMGELKQMVEDLPDAPKTLEDVEYYMGAVEFFGTNEYNGPDRTYLRREIIRKYNVPD